MNSINEKQEREYSHGSNCCHRHDRTIRLIVRNSPKTGRSDSYSYGPKRRVKKCYSK